MNYPVFFNHIPVIKVYDPLADFLGAVENGIVEFSYIDIVKSAGHSCPTIAGAYLLTFHALKSLYPDSLPLRGGIKIELKESINEGVTGVIANVITQITGATKESGFKGIAGKFIRHSLLEFDVDMEGLVRFTRLNNGKTVELNYSPVVPTDPQQQQLMQKLIGNTASEDEAEQFKTMWQERVRKLLIENFDNPKMIEFI
ncbi:MAG: hypothetical protein PF484_00240 [Bacteroidales bacterium]|jgi:hypothetical protein|nr:hypothetical protein [Bacteroidales bacterium]